MIKRTEKQTTREGPACGESLGAPDSRCIGPDVYGRATNRTDVAGEVGTTVELVVERVLDVDESGSVSDCSLVTIASEVSDVSGAPCKLWQGRKRKIGGMEVSESSGEETPPKSRGRGRPPTTGEFVGLAQAKKELNAQLREELRLQAELELAATVDSFRKTRPVRLVGTVGPTGTDDELSSKTAEELIQRVDQEVALIGTIATKSRNLKSTYVRDLKVAAASIKEAVAAMGSRTVDDETRRLQSELSSVRKELESLKKDMERLRPRHADPSREAEVSPIPATPSSLEDICRAVSGMVGNMLDARLSSIEDRLLPEKRLRPPLASDRPAQVCPVPSAKPRVAAPRTSPPPEVPGAKKKAKKPKKGKDEETFVPAPPPPPPTEAWSVVVRKGAKRARGLPPPPPPQVQQLSQSRQQPQTQGQRSAKQPQQRQRSAQPQWQQQGRKKRQAKEKRKRQRKLRSPRSAAVVVTLKPEAEAKGVTYEQVLTRAKGSVSLAELGIPSLRIKRTATGARSLEVVGANNAERADSLAAKLTECLGEVARVHRPFKTAEMRVSGLDDSVSTGEVIAALAKVGGCSVEQLQAGVMSVGANGLGSVWIRCPVAVAKKVVDGGKLLVGWVSAQVKLLEDRTQRCFRCLEEGHMRAQCKSAVDRSDECYRCGKAGHKARGCEAPSHCNACSAAGRPADHRVGGKACKKPPAAKRKRGSAKQNTQARAEEEDKMAVG